MNILFLTLANVYDIGEHDIYQDLMRCFRQHGDLVYVVTGIEKRNKTNTELYESYGCNILRVKTGNQSECSLLEKGISTIKLQIDYYIAIKKYISEIKFDLILYSTPPITLVALINRLKREHKCTTYLMLKDISMKQEGTEIKFERANENAKAMHGTMNALVNNMIIGVTKGYEKGLEIVGVGYRFNVQGKKIVVSAGYSHPVEVIVPDGLTAELISNTEIVIKGIDKQKVSEFAANVRKIREPEPYKGKGIRYKGEFVSRKEGKKAA